MTRWARRRLSPLVFAAANNGDAVSKAIVSDSADHISHVARVIWGLHPTRLSLVGGLGQTVEPWLATDVREILSPALHTPLDGAILCAREQLTTATIDQERVANVGLVRPPPE